MTISEIWQKILSAPGDEGLKTQYVEALTQVGDHRAEVFRLAEELNRLPHGYFDRHAELTQQYEIALTDWRTQLETPAKTWGAEIHFIVGWPIEITISAADFARHAPAIVATLPLRHLNLTAVSETPEVFEVAQLGQIASVDGSNQPWSTEAVRALAASPHLSALRWLNLSRTGLKDAQVKILAASPQLKHLSHLDLQHNPCRDPVDAAAGYGVDGFSGYIVPESIWLPDFGRELEARYGRIEWLHALGNFMEDHPPSRYSF